MGTITKRGDKWRCQIRRAGHKPISRSFPKKSMAIEWARSIESAIDEGRYSDRNGVVTQKFGDIISLYTDDIGEMRKFGKNKVAVLRSLNSEFGDVNVTDLSDDMLIDFVKKRARGGAGGVTISVDLSYISTLLRYAKSKLKIPVSSDIVQSARDNMRYMGIKTRSNERTRRPTEEEIKLLCEYWDNNPMQKTPMSDIVLFAIETAMRDSEIMRITWDDLNETDRTVIIRDRKHPTQKLGNDHEVPLLGDAFNIIMRQPRKSEKIFPYNPHSVSTVFTRTCSRLQIKDLRFHDLRHEGISRLFERGFTIEQVMLVSGHRSPNMLFRYVQLKAKDLHKFDNK